VSTGPFKFVRWKVGREVILETNKDYWDKAHAGSSEWWSGTSGQLPAVGRAQGGRITVSRTQPDDVKVVRADPNLQIILRPTNTTGYVAFNYKVKELRDGRVRQAIAHAINKKAIVDALYGGTGMVANQFQPPPLR
jgi:peptide/nickel transport system substrate-binding protein